MGFFGSKKKKWEDYHPVTTTETIPGKEIVRYMGLVHVKSSAFTDKTIHEAFSEIASMKGANAVIGIREIFGKIIGTAVIVKDKDES